MTMPEKQPERRPPQRVTAEEEEEYTPPSSGHGNRGGNKMNWKSLILPVIVSIVVVVVMSMMGFSNWATKDTLKLNFDNLQTAIVKIQTDTDANVNSIKQTVTGVQNTINTLLSSITTQVQNQITQATTLLTAQITSIQSQVNNMASTVKSASDKADQSATAISNLSAKVESYRTQQAIDEAKIVDFDTRLKATEAKLVPTTTPTGTSTSIPGVTITVDVKEEGTLQSDNSTLAEIKVIINNTSAVNIEDLVLSIFVYIDQCGYANQTLTVSGYGSWSIRNRSTDEIEIRGRLTTLSSGDKRNIYLDIKSFAIDYQHGNVTYIDTSSKDLEIISWDKTS